MPCVLSRLRRLAEFDAEFRCSSAHFRAAAARAASRSSGMVSGPAHRLTLANQGEARLRMRSRRCRLGSVARVRSARRWGTSGSRAECLALGYREAATAVIAQRPGWQLWTARPVRGGRRRRRPGSQALGRSSGQATCTDRFARPSQYPVIVVTGAGDSAAPSATNSGA